MTNPAPIPVQDFGKTFADEWLEITRRNRAMRRAKRIAAILDRK